MITIKNIFAVIDPTKETQRALDRAVHIANITRATIHAYVCVYSNLEADDPDDLRRTEMSRYSYWLDKILEPLKAQGLDVKAQIDWNEDWRKAIAVSAKAVDSDLIIKPSRTHSASERVLMHSSDLALFKTAQCPVLLIKSEEGIRTHNVLMAIDAKREDSKYNEIRDKIVDFGKAASSAYEDGELYAVHGYSTQDKYVHVTDFGKITRLDNDHVRVVGAEPEEAIARVAKEIDAQLIIIGLSTKSTLVNRVFGSTGEWLLNNLNQDLLVIFPED